MSPSVRPETRVPRTEGFDPSSSGCCRCCCVWSSCGSDCDNELVFSDVVVGGVVTGIIPG